MILSTFLFLHKTCFNQIVVSNFLLDFFINKFVAKKHITLGSQLEIRAFIQIEACFKWKLNQIVDGLLGPAVVVEFFKIRSFTPTLMDHNFNDSNRSLGKLGSKVIEGRLLIENLQ